MDTVLSTATAPRPAAASSAPRVFPSPADDFNRLCLEMAGESLTPSEYPIAMVDRLLQLARDYAASDLHLQPSAEETELKLRIDGVLHLIGLLPASVASRLAARVKVMAELVHYRNDVPQEGRIIATDRQREMRVSLLPTLYGEKMVIRFFSGPSCFAGLDDLGYPDDVLTPLRRLLSETSGAIVVTGPAGSGKTSTLYACLREMLDAAGPKRSLVSLEDPIEVAVPGVAQSEVNPLSNIDLHTGLRYLMRQDPEVIMMGEIRDRFTAEAVLQASLTGHLLLSTFHAGSAAEAVRRLLEMEIEPYLLRSGLLAILSQRLVRRLCSCARPTDDEQARLGLPVEQVRVPVGCELCNRTGYNGRMVLVELMRVDGDGLTRAIVERADARTLEHMAVSQGMVTRWDRGCRAVCEGHTSPAEIRRVLGFVSEAEKTPHPTGGNGDHTAMHP